MKIEKNIPAPRKPMKWMPLAKQMNVGDSVLIPTTSDRSALTMALKSQGYKVATRKEGDQIRVWRIS
jgi:hypothetical protein